MDDVVDEVTVVAVVADADVEDVAAVCVGKDVGVVMCEVAAADEVVRAFSGSSNVLVQIR